MNAEDIVTGQLMERKAITRLLAFQAARAGYRAAKAPWWQFRHRRNLRWTMACTVNLIDSIETGEQHREVSQWMGDWTGEKLDRAVLEAVGAYELPTPQEPPHAGE